MGTLSKQLASVKYVLLFAFITLSGCEALNSEMISQVVKQPELDVESVSVTGLDLETVDLLLKLKVNNPNAFKLALSGYRYNVSLNQKSMFSSDQGEGFNVPAYGQQVVNVPLTIGFNDAMNLVKEVGPGKPLAYAVDADLFMDVVVMKNFKVSASKTGEITIPQIPSVSVQKLDVRKFSFSGADLALRLKVDNPNNFALSLKDIQYKLGSSGTQWAQGRMKQMVNLGKQDSTIVSIPFSVSFANVGTGLLKMVQQGNFSGVNVGGQFTVDSELPMLKGLKVPLDFSL